MDSAGHALSGTPPITREAIFRCGPPLRLVFWGGLLCLFDFDLSSVTNGRGFQVDIISDFVGVLMILVGVIRIARLKLDSRWNGHLTLVIAVAVASAAAALQDHFIFPRPEVLGWVLSLLSLAELAAIIVFCVVMKSYCYRAGLVAAEASWKMTLLLFLFIYVVPLGLLTVAGLVGSVTGADFHVDLGPAGLLLLPVFFWPLVHLFMSTSRMSRAGA